MKAYNLAIVLGLSAGILPGWGGGIPWTDSAYYHFAQNQALESLVHDFAAIQGIDVVIGAPLSGTVNGIFENTPPGEFWENLTKAYNLAWFYDGAALYLYPGSMVTTQVLAMSQQDGQALKALVGELNFASSNIGLRYVPSTRMMVVSGPPRFLEVVQSLLDKIQSNIVQSLTDETVVQIFPLKYAFAYDVTLTVGTGQGATIEGIATLLQRIIAGINTIPQMDGGSVAIGSLGNVPRAMEGVLKQKIEAGYLPISPAHPGTIAAQKSATDKAKKGDSFPEGAKASSAAGASTTNPKTSYVTSISADARLNAVIIRDQKDLMPFYRALIDRFDVPTRAVEIQVAMVDVDVGKSRSLGLDVLDFLGDKVGPVSWMPTGDEGETTNFTVAIADLLGYKIDAKISALESATVARTLSRPSLLTLDNLAAVISRSDSTFVSVAGSYTADLFPVSATVSLTVIPHIIDLELADGTPVRQFKLFVSIQDGTMSALGGASGMPRVSSTQINTQAVLDEGHSLVVGGYYREEHSNIRKGIPFMRALPFVGRLFGSEDTKTSNIERLFIISPRIVELNAMDGDPYGQFFRKANLSGRATLLPREFACTPEHQEPSDPTVPERQRPEGKVKKVAKDRAPRLLGHGR
ncbi:MAG: hypothetical protein LBP65_02575 [Puniceicoccales bacterium]|jgi:type III secretion protein C|nr:hypothetical protein [Puniceicoccales bacterium]